MNFSQHFWLLGVIAGLTVVTVVTRSFFLLMPRRFEFPESIKKALRYAPTVAITAIIAPDILMHQGAVDLSWHNPDLLAGLAVVAVFVWRHSLVWSLIAGMVVFTLFRLYT